MIHRINKNILLEESVSAEVNAHIKRNAPAYIGGAGLIGAGLAYRLANPSDDNNNTDSMTHQTTIINQDSDESPVMNGLKTAAAIGSLGYLGSRIGSNTNNIITPLIGNQNIDIAKHLGVKAYDKLNDFKQDLKNKYNDLNNTKWHYNQEINDPKPSTKYTPKQSGFFKSDQNSVITPITPNLNIQPKTNNFGSARTAPKDKRKFAPKRAK